METQITKRQHYVPCTYQKGWTVERWSIAGQGGLVHIHDLKEKRHFSCGPQNSFLESFFYEEDKKAPNNEVEIWFHQFEAPYGVVMAAIDRPFALINEMQSKGDPRLADPNIHAIVAENFWRDVKFSSVVAGGLNFCIDTIKRFAAVAYARTPATIQLKQTQLLNSPDASWAPIIDTPYKFIKTFEKSTLIDRFLRSKIQLLIFPGGGLITGDRPCFDFSASTPEMLPLVGSDFMNDPSVAAFMPLSPYLGALFYQDGFAFKDFKIGHAEPFSVRTFLKESEVQTVNAVVVNMAGRRVLSTKIDEGIYCLRTTPFI